MRKQNSPFSELWLLTLQFIEACQIKILLSWWIPEKVPFHSLWISLVWKLCWERKYVGEILF